MAVQRTEANRSSGGGEPSFLQASGKFITVELSSEHLTQDFSCARDPAAVAYIQTDIWKYLSHRCGAGYVLPAPGRRAGKIWGFYHLVGANLARGDAQNGDQKMIPVGAPAPVYTIAYVARCDTSPPKIGGALIVDAAQRAYSLFPNWGMTLYANNAKLVEYYEGFGFKVIRKLKQQKQANAGQLEGDGPFHMYAHYGDLILPPEPGWSADPV